MRNIQSQNPNRACQKNSKRVAFRLLALGLAIGLMFALASCGSESSGPGYTVGGNQGSIGNSGQGISDGTGNGGPASNAGGGSTSVSNATVGEITLETATDNDMVYVAEEFKVTTTDFTDYFCMVVEGDKLCYGNQHAVISYPLDGGSMEMETMYWEEQEGTWSLKQLAFDGAGNVYAIVSVAAMPKVKPYFCKFDEEGQNIFAYALEDLLAERNASSWSSNWELVADESGNTFFLAANTIWVFDAEGEYQGTVNLGNGPGYEVRDLTRDDAGVVYTVYNASGNSSNTFVGQIDFASLATVNVNKGQGITGIFAGAEDTLFLYAGDTVYNYDIVTGTMTPAFKWLECDVNSNYLQYAGVAEDGRMMAVTFDHSAMGEIQLLQKMTKAEAEAAGLLGGKTTITLAVGWNYNYIQQLMNAVAEFNKTNEKYTVTVENYSDGAEDADASVNRLNNEIVSGKGPDLIADHFGNFEDLATKGGIANLYDFLENSTELSKEDFFDTILKKNTVEGILTAIPQNFYLQTMVGSSDVVGTKMGWTLEEMYALAEKYPGQAIIGRSATITKKDVVRMILEFNGELFLDEEAGTCNFATEDFEKVLTFAESYPTEYESAQGKPSIYTRLEAGEILLANVNAFNIRGFQAYDEALGGKLTFIGYPTANGVGCSLQENDAIAISSTSQNQEGAWAFLEFYLQYYDMEFLSNVNGLPTNKVAMEKLAKLSMTDEVSTVVEYGDGWRFKDHKATQEEIDKIYALIENMQFVSVDADVISIVLEEANSYFSGQKPLETVIGIIQNRVQNYLDEQGN